MSAPVREKVIVALSGGVDSAVAALCLLAANHPVEALHMTNWEDGDANCTAAEDLAQARLVASELGITLHHVRFEREYRERVFRDFLEQYASGRTPNPDIGCNRHIKFGVMLEHVRRLGATWLATGHYARVVHGSSPRLLKAADRNKDQTYFLHRVAGSALAHVLFPLGGLTKAEVRRMATDHGLPNHARRDSTGICFIGKRPFQSFLGSHLDAPPGPVLSLDGTILGEHQGLPGYTLGQRQGIGLGGRRGGQEAPWYVAAKDPERNALIVVQGHDHPALFSTGVIAGEVHWISGCPPGLAAGSELHCEARIRHRQPLVPCTASLGSSGLRVQFDQPQRAATPGQSVVLYAGEQCLGGGEIDRCLPLARLQGLRATA